MIVEDATKFDRNVWAGWLHLDPKIKRFDDLREVGNAWMAHPYRTPGAAAVFRMISDWHPNLTPADASQVVLPEGALDEMLDEVGRLLPVEDRFALQRRLLEIIDSGNRAGRFRIPIHRIPIPPIPEPPSPFQHEAFERVVAISPAIDRFTACLGFEGTLDDRETWGRIFLSALCFGGMTKAAWLLAIERALTSASDSEFRWLDLTIPSPSASSTSNPADDAVAMPEEPALRFRRWFPDPITRLLLKRWHVSGKLPMPQSGRTLAARAMRLIRAYARAQSFEQHLPTTFSQLASAFETRMQLHAPPFFVAYASERTASTSLPAAAWQRLVSPPASLRLEVLSSPGSPAFTPVADAGDGPQPSPDDPETMREREEELWPDQLRTLASLILRSPPGEIEQRVRDWKSSTQESLIPSVACLADWVTGWLLQEHKLQRKLRPKTIYQKLNCAGARVVARLGCRDPAALGDEDDYVDLVEGVLEDIEDESVRRRAASALRSFCTFLAKEKHAPAMSDIGIFNVGSANGYSVDANLISVNTFFLALRSLTDGSLPNHSSDRNVNEALCHIATLGFFGGLRRSEALGLRLCDLEVTPGDVYLSVCPNHLRELKSSNAYRRLPLHVLLPKIRLDTFIAWKREQEKAGARGADPLFPMFVSGSRILDTTPRLRLITDAIQAAAGDPTLRFHHLRHSFATWMVVKLWLADQRISPLPIPDDIKLAIESGSIELTMRGQPDAWTCALPRWFLHTEHDHARWREALAERHELLGLAPTNRRALNLVSQLLGHGSTEITLGSYVHLMDFLLGCTIRRMAPRFGTRQLAALSGLTAETVKLLKSRHRHAGSDDAAARLLDAVINVAFPPGSPRPAVKPQPRVDFHSKSNLQPPKDRYLRLIHEAEALAVAAKGDLNVGTIAARFGMPASQLSKAVKKLALLPAGFAIYAAGLSHWRPGLRGEFASISAPSRPSEVEIGKLTLAAIDSQIANPTYTKQQARTARDQFMKLLDGVVEGWIPGTHADMHFGSVKPAQRWLQFLGKLGLAGGVVIYHVPLAHQEPEQRAVQAAAWKKYLNWPSLLQEYSGPALPNRSGARTREATSVLVRIELDRMPGGRFLGQSKLPALSAIRLVFAMCYVFPHQLVAA